MDDIDPFEVLNVPVDADEAAIDRAWKAKLRIVHPDRHLGATPEVRARLAHRARELNEARELLRDPVRRADAARARPSSPPPPPPTPHPPDACEVCGGRPVETYRFRRANFSFGWPDDARWERTLCRTCGLAEARHELARSLALAWIVWPPLLASLPALWTNWRTLRAAHAATPPVTSAGRPRDPGRPLALRWRSWVFGVITTTLLAAVVIGSLQPDPDPTRVEREPSGVVALRTADPARGEAPYAFRLGDCVLGSHLVQPIPCDQPHAGVVVGTAYDLAQCSPTTDALIEDQAIPVCVDLDR